MRVRAVVEDYARKRGDTPADHLRQGNACSGRQRQRRDQHQTAAAATRDTDFAIGFVRRRSGLVRCEAVANDRIVLRGVIGRSACRDKTYNQAR